MCQQSPAFLRYWNFLENDLCMWIDPFLRWEEGDSLPVHQHLGTLAALLPRRHDLVKLSAFICKHVYDAFIEHPGARSTRQCRRQAAVVNS
mmetsp:Transcript_3881/g.12039  ORF Transcript_3881/g.12039 Transcript_3881/m.12039 type:complete len:91 (+) Transcript_3881:705-977(+)